jgi:hypothetical protein
MVDIRPHGVLGTHPLASPDSSVASLDGCRVAWLLPRFYKTFPQQPQQGLTSSPARGVAPPVPHSPSYTFFWDTQP